MFTGLDLDVSFSSQWHWQLQTNHVLLSTELGKKKTTETLWKYIFYLLPHAGKEFKI